jgi:hypothetical protein
MSDMLDQWTEDGHVLVVEQDGEFPEEGDVRMRVECPGDHGGKCEGPYVACDYCNGNGYHFNGDAERPCPKCKESGREGGIHTCWLKTYGMEDDLPDHRSDEPPYLLGRFKLLYQTDGYYDSFTTPMLRGERLADPPARKEQPDA